MAIPYRNWAIALVVTNLLTITLVLFLGRVLPPVVPLFYGQPYGPDQLATRNFLIFPSFIALAICLINSTVSRFLTDEFLKRVLVGSMLASTIMALVTVLKIIFLVGSF